MKSPGVISHWNDAKGFGFIRPDEGGEEVFLHISALRGDQRPQVGDQVRFVSGKDPQGRPRAEHAHLVGLAIDEPVRESRSVQNPRVKAAIFLALCALPAISCIRVVLVGQGPVRWVFALVYPVVSLLTCLAYWLDKRSALRGEWRTPEVQLHLLEMLGGWPGALIAQQSFRHKTRKVSFQVVFWVIVLAHQAFLLWVNFFIRS